MISGDLVHGRRDDNLEGIISMEWLLLTILW